MQLNKTVALITGGAQGIGKRITQTLLNRGAKVIVADVDVEAGEKFQDECVHQFGRNRFHFLKCDLSKQEELNKTFEEAGAHFGRLDIVCNNAGMMTTEVQHTRLQVDLNLTAVMEGTFKGIELMSKQNGGGGGVIVNVASAAGLDLMKGAAVYTATKQAVVAFSRSFYALPYHTVDGVRVNCICPFYCDTRMVRSAARKMPGAFSIIEKIGWVGIDDIAKAFMTCVENDEMNAKVVVIEPPDKIFEMEFPKWRR